ncbi:hypothetical protein ACFL0T_08855, partial [Candidatus Omnitrophota bacterium]
PLQLATNDEGGPFSVGNWLTYAEIPDTKTKEAKIKITDHSNSDVTDTSNTFWCYPLITDVTVTATPDDQQGATYKVWRAGESDHEVKWTENSSEISAVDIYYSTTGSGGLPGNPLETNKPSTIDGVNSYSSITVPTTINNNTIIRVRDYDSTLGDPELFAGKVFDDSDRFYILGKIAFGASPSSGADWYVGDTNKTVTWSSAGDGMSLEVLIDYGSGYESVTTLAQGATPWDFDDPGTQDEGVDDEITETCKIMLRDSNTSTWRQQYTEYESPTFNITGLIEDVAAVPAAGDTMVVAGKSGPKITWEKTGSAISHVLIQYTLDGDTWYTLDDGEAPAGYVPNNKQYNWTTQATDISDICEIEITDPDNSACQGTLDGFIMASKVEVDLPDTLSSWSANESNDITWTKWGDFDYVNIYYSSDGGENWDPIDDTGVQPSSNVDADHGTYEWFIDSSYTLSPSAKIKVIDAVNESFAAFVPSDTFITKGTVSILLPDGADTYVCGEAIQVRWERFGNIAAVDIHYSTNGTAYTPIAELQNVAFEGEETWHEEYWTPPELVSTTYYIRVRDTANPAIKNPSVPFVLQGSIALTDPDAQAPTIEIDTPYTVKWNVIHGNIANVKILGSRSGNFTGADDTFWITTLTKADNVTTFDAANFGTFGYVSQGQYEWSAAEQQPVSIITNDTTAKVRILDANTDYSVQSDSSSAGFMIRGDLDITTPSSDWHVGDSDDAEVAWTAHGNIVNVDIEFNNGGTWIDVTDPATGTPSGAGDKSFSVGNWLTYAEIPDVKSSECKLRITDRANSNVSIVSNTFWAYPDILTAAVSETPQIADKKPIVSWTYSPTSETEEVAIWLDPNGDGNLADGTALETGVDITSSPHET